MSARLYPDNWTLYLAFFRELQALAPFQKLDAKARLISPARSWGCRCGSRRRFRRWGRTPHFDAQAVADARAVEQAAPDVAGGQP